MKSTDQQHNHQINYFKKEYSSKEKYKLNSWKASYIRRIKMTLGTGYKNKILLDIGTGGGYVAIEMSKLGLNVIALDLSPMVIKNLKRYSTEHGIKNIKFIVCPAEAIPLSNNSVDFIIANAVLEHIVDEKATIIEWKRLLKKDGIIYITTPLKYKYIWPFFWPINYIHDKMIGHLRRYDEKELAKKFNMKIDKVYFTGHFIKVLSVLIGKVIRIQIAPDLVEKLDSYENSFKYGASNLSLVMRRKV